MNTPSTPPNLAQNGSILIITLLVISILVVTVTETLRRMQVEQASTAVYTGFVQGQSRNRAALACIKHLLAEDVRTQERAMDHLHEPWARFPDQSEVPLPPLGPLNATITAENSKFPINAIVDDDGNWNTPYKDVFERLLRLPPFAVPEETLEQLLPALKDWMDPDNTPTGVHGAEKDAYTLQGSSVAPRNGPVQSLDELRHVRHMPARLFRATGHQPPLYDLLSVHTGSRININTASPILLAALVNPSVRPETAKAFAENMVRYRNDPFHFEYLHEADWYRNRMAGFNDIQLPPKLISTTSSTFAITLTARIGAVRASRYTLLKRDIQGDSVAFSTLYTEVQ